jgi:hypothetical protein
LIPPRKSENAPTRRRSTWEVFWSSPLRANRVAELWHPRYTGQEKRDERLLRVDGGYREASIRRPPKIEIVARERSSHARAV